VRAGLKWELGDVAMVLGVSARVSAAVRGEDGADKTAPRCRERGARRANG
jgi:hypothetical protein